MQSVWANSVETSSNEADGVGVAVGGIVALAVGGGDSERVIVSVDTRLALAVDVSDKS